MEPQTPYAPRRSQPVCPRAKLRERRFVWRGHGLLPPIGPAWARRASVVHGLWLLVLAVVLASPHPVLAAAADWVLVCPDGSLGEPQFRDQRGHVFPIILPGERAIAEKLCSLSLPSAAENVSVSVTNNGANTIYLAFTDYSTQLPGPIDWTNCMVVNNQVTIGQNTTCNALVPGTAGLTRFCAFTSQVPVGQSPNCNVAQARN